MRKLLIAALLLSFSACAFAQQDYVGRYDVFAGFSYLNSPKLNLEQRGFNTQVGVNATRWLAMGFDYSIQQGKGTLARHRAQARSLQAADRDAFPLPPGYSLCVPFSATTQTFTGGPQLSWRHFKRATFFVHPSIGAIHEHINLEPHDADHDRLLWEVCFRLGCCNTTAPSDTTYFYGLGGGADFIASKHVHLRADVEFVHVFLFSGLLADSRNSVRLSIGPTFNFGKNVAGSPAAPPQTKASSIETKPWALSSCFALRVLPTLGSTLMPIAHLTLELRIEGAQSLKDRRQVLRSLKDRLRSGFNVSVAEIDPTDLWQSATLGVVAISSSRDYLDGLMKQVESAATRIANNHGAEITDSFVDFLD